MSNVVTFPGFPGSRKVVTCNKYPRSTLNTRQIYVLETNKLKQKVGISTSRQCHHWVAQSWSNSLTFPDILT